MARVKLSILIPTKDRPERIRRAVDSALQQRYGDIEVIVKDGGKSIEHLLPEHPRLRYLRCPDTSIANALNQAVELATGDVMHFACDDDEMLAFASKSAMRAILRGAKWTYGIMQIVRYEGVKRVKLGNNGGISWSSALMMDHNFVPQPTVYWTRQVWDECGPFNEDFPLCFDYEMWGRFGARWSPTVRKTLDAYYEQHSGSISIHSQRLQRAEVRAIQRLWLKHGFGCRQGEYLNGRRAVAR